MIYRITSGLWRQAICLLLLLALAGPLLAQTYAYRSETFAYDTPSGSATSVTWHSTKPAPACTGYPDGDDDWADVSFPGGFSFRFAGTAYTQVRVNSNGYLTFGTDVSGFHRDYSNAALPATAGATYSGCPTAAPVRMMVPYWTDIVAGTANSTSGASIRYELLGTAPNRRFVISWVNVKLYNQTERYNFQVVLWESAASTDGEFSYRYSSGASNGSAATVGVQVSSTDYTQYSFNQSFIDTTNGTAIRWYPVAVSPAQVGEYRLDESVGWPLVPTVGEVVVDSSGTGHPGQRIGVATTYPAKLNSAQVCAGANIASNTLNTAISAIDLGQTPGEIGTAGSITFWYRSTDAWSSGRNSTLFDAGTLAASPFHLSRMRSGSNDVLRFALTDSAGTVRSLETGDYGTAAGTWVHIAVSWYLLAGANQSVMQIFVNGQRVAFSRFTSSGALHASLGSTYFGDNRTVGIAPSNGTANSAYGDLDEIRLYNFDLSAPQAARDRLLTRANCSPLDHFSISHSGSGSVCQSNQVRIYAHDVNHNAVSLVGTTMNITTTPASGSWTVSSATGTLTNLGNGSATYVWNNESDVLLNYSSSAGGTVNFNVVSGGVTENSGTSVSGHDPSMSLGTCVSRFNACEPTNPRCNPASTGYQRLYTKLAGTAFTLDGVALKADGSLETGFSGTLAVDLLANTSTGVALDANNCPVSVSQTISLGNVTFAAGRAVSGSVTVPTAYRDVRARFSCSAAVCGTAITACSTDNFAVRPTAFTVTANLGGPKLKAGQAFTLAADSGVGAQYAGTPVLDTSMLRDHLGNTAGTLVGTLPASVSGVSTGSFVYHDVGTLSLQQDAVTDANYTTVDSASGDCLSGSTSNTASGGMVGCTIGSIAAGPFGRFYPDHFNFTGSLSAACSGFVYMGQPALGVSFSLQARSANESVTTRYTSGYGYLGTPVVAGDDAGTAVSLSRLSPALPAAAWASGVYTVSQPTTTFTRVGSPDGPFESFALLASVTGEPDSVAISGTAATNTVKVRYGRLRLSNVFGSEKASLSMPLQAQFWTGKSWLLNNLDSCTTLAANNFFLSGGIAANTAASAVTLAGGKADVVLAKPTPTATGSVDVAINLGASGSDLSCLSTHGGTAAAKSWLRSRNGNCATTYDRDPSARATFGIYSPETRKNVHIRELY